MCSGGDGGDCSGGGGGSVGGGVQWGGGGSVGGSIRVNVMGIEGEQRGKRWGKEHGRAERNLFAI